jgi:hypothetical protein
MFAVVRRYEGRDMDRQDELFREVGKGFLLNPAETPGFIGHFFVDAGDGVAASIGIFETRDAAEESARAAADCIREQIMQGIVPNPPQVTAGEVRVHKMRAGVAA